MPDRKRIAGEIIHTMPLVMRSVSADLRCHRAGVAPAHLGLLGMLSERPRSLSELADLQGVTPATMSNSVATLVERGWVERVSEPGDRRVVLARITRTGSEVLAHALARLENRILLAMDALTDEDLEALDRGVGVLNRLFQQADWGSPGLICPDETVGKLNKDRDALAGGLHQGA